MIEVISLFCHKNSHTLEEMIKKNLTNGFGLIIDGSKLFFFEF